MQQGYIACCIFFNLDSALDFVMGENMKSDFFAINF